jgi:hypothetical protein
VQSAACRSASSRLPDCIASGLPGHLDIDIDISRAISQAAESL